MLAFCFMPVFFSWQSGPLEIDGTMIAAPIWAGVLMVFNHFLQKGRFEAALSQIDPPEPVREPSNR